MIKQALTALAILAGAYLPSSCAPAFAMTIVDDDGGTVQTYVTKYTVARLAGERIVIDGFCASSCTLVTGLVKRDQVCVTPFAKLAFHSASLSGAFHREATRYLWAMYPQVVRDILMERGWDGDNDTEGHPDLIYVEGAELLTIFQACE